MLSTAVLLFSAVAALGQDTPTPQKPDAANFPGMAQDIQVGRSLRFGLDEKTIEEFTKWRFKPEIFSSTSWLNPAQPKRPAKRVGWGPGRPQPASGQSGGTGAAAVLLSSNWLNPAQPKPNKAGYSWQSQAQGLRPPNFGLQRSGVCVVPLLRALVPRDIDPPMLVKSHGPTESMPRALTPPTCGDAKDGVSKIGQVDSAPEPLYRPPPEYTEEARNAKLQGTVLLYVEIDERGMTRNIRVLRPLGLGLDEKAVEAVSKWRFKPGVKDGHAVTVGATIEVNFRLSPP